MNPEIEQLKNFMAVATYIGYALVGIAVFVIGWFLAKFIKNRIENQTDSNWFENVQQHPRSFLAFMYISLAGIGLLGFTFIEYWLHYYHYEFSPSLNQVIVFWFIYAGFITIIWSKIVQSDFSIRLLTWYNQNPEIRLMMLSVALYLLLVVPLQLLDPSRPTLDLVWLQSLLYGSLGLAWFHTFARLLMKISYPNIDSFMAGNEQSTNNANNSFNQLPSWLQLVISLLLLLCFVLVQAMISKIL